jgi:hypothetical protein
VFLDAFRRKIVAPFIQREQKDCLLYSKFWRFKRVQRYLPVLSVTWKFFFLPSSRQNVSVEQIPNVSAFGDFLSAGMQMFMGTVAVQQGKHDY